MPTWEEYKKTAKERGALAFELYVVETTPVGTPEALTKTLPAHLDYQKKLESDGSLFLAGPVSDPTGELMQGNGLIVYRAASMDDADKLAKNDPMHKEGVRTYTIRKWLINEASPNFSSILAAQNNQSSLKTS
ncbi:MAG: YciI family protein [Parvularculales bacterium]